MGFRQLLDKAPFRQNKNLENPVTSILNTLSNYIRTILSFMKQPAYFHDFTIRSAFYHIINNIILHIYSIIYFCPVPFGWILLK